MVDDDERAEFYVRQAIADAEGAMRMLASVLVMLALVAVGGLAWLVWGWR